MNYILVKIKLICERMRKEEMCNSVQSKMQINLRETKNTVGVSNEFIISRLTIQWDMKNPGEVGIIHLFVE